MEYDGCVFNDNGINPDELKAFMEENGGDI